MAKKLDPSTYRTPGIIQASRSLLMFSSSITSDQSPASLRPESAEWVEPQIRSHLQMAFTWALTNTMNQGWTNSSSWLFILSSPPPARKFAGTPGISLVKWPQYLIIESTCHLKKKDLKCISVSFANPCTIWNFRPFSHPKKNTTHEKPGFPDIQGFPCFFHGFPHVTWLGLPAGVRAPVDGVPWLRHEGIDTGGPFRKTSLMVN